MSSAPTDRSALLTEALREAAASTMRLSLLSFEDELAELLAIKAHLLGQDQQAGQVTPPEVIDRRVWAIRSSAPAARWTPAKGPVRRILVDPTRRIRAP
jgi:hypothetical protein